MNPFEDEIDALRRHGSIVAAAYELGITPKTLKARIKRSGYDARAFVSSTVRGRNAGIRRTMLDGTVVSVGKPMPEQITIEDVARGLARIGWNTGQTHGYFSLAAVSWLFAEHVLELTKDHDMSLAALFWYSSAAYIGYIPHFLEDKVSGNWSTIKREMMMSIQDAFDMRLTAALHEDFFNDEKRKFEHWLEDVLVRGTEKIDIGKSSSTRIDEAQFVRQYTALKAIEKMKIDKGII